MKKTLYKSLLFFIGLTSCTSDKKYSDYNEDDFYEVQGIINYAVPTSDPYDDNTVKNVSFSYFLDRPKPKRGIEQNLDMFEAQNGYPLIVLVHKKDENISFYGRVGIHGNLNELEKKAIKKHLYNELEKLKSKVHKATYEKVKKELDEKFSDY